MSSLYLWFRGVRGKLLLSTALPLIALTIVSGFGYYGLKTFDSYLNRAYGQVTPTVDAINRMNTSKSDILRYFWKAYSLKTDISSRNQSIQKIREAYDKGESIEWKRVHLLPDFVNFNHAAHVTKGVNCETCHGPVQTMKQVSQFSDLSMGWCINCHRQPENKAPTSCSTCHQ